MTKKELFLEEIKYSKLREENDWMESYRLFLVTYIVT